MPSWIAPDGRPVATPPDRSKPRGRRLSLEGGIRLRDLLALLLIDDLGLSKPDAAFVLGLGGITESQLRRRLERCPANARDIVRELRKVVD